MAVAAPIAEEMLTSKIFERGAKSKFKSIFKSKKKYKSHKSSKSHKLLDNEYSITDNISKIKTKDVISFVISLVIGYSLAATTVNGYLIFFKMSNFKNMIMAVSIIYLIIGVILSLMRRKEGWGIIIAGGLVLFNYSSTPFMVFSNKIMATIIHFILTVFMYIALYFSQKL